MMGCPRIRTGDDRLRPVLDPTDQGNKKVFESDPGGICQSVRGKALLDSGTV